MCRGLSCSKCWLSSKSNILESCMHSDNCRCFQAFLRMFLQHLRVLCIAPGGLGSIRNYMEVVVRLTGVSGRLIDGFQTALHVANIEVRCMAARINILIVVEFAWILSGLQNIYTQNQNQFPINTGYEPNHKLYNIGILWIDGILSKIFTWVNIFARTPTMWVLINCIRNPTRKCMEFQIMQYSSLIFYKQLVI